jgi:hypothetical protein
MHANLHSTNRILPVLLKGDLRQIKAESLRLPCGSYDQHWARAALTLRHKSLQKPNLFPSAAFGSLSNFPLGL